jgi:hypothetical protein
MGGLGGKGAGILARLAGSRFGSNRYIRSEVRFLTFAALAAGSGIAAACPSGPQVLREAGYDLLLAPADLDNHS